MLRMKTTELHIKILLAHLNGGRQACNKNLFIQSSSSKGNLG